MSAELEYRSKIKGCRRWNDSGVGLANGTWHALCCLARALGEDVPAWEGHHDGQVYTQQHLQRIAARAADIGRIAPALKELAAIASGGIRIV